MKNVAIIAEYNPMHNGHLYQMSTIGDNNIIVAMSGNFTERGDIAVANKYTRARLAIMHGASIVVEIPTMGVLSCAEHYAQCAIKVLSLLGGVDELCFGSEVGDIAALKSIAHTKEDEIIRSNIAKLMDSGMSYPAALSNTLGMIDSDYAKILAEPNNILGIEYIRALTGTSIEPITIPRIGARYNDNSLSSDYASASSIRENIHDAAVEKYLPHDILDTVRDIRVNKDALLHALYQKMIIDRIDVSDINNVNEGIDNRILTMLSDATSYDDLLEKIKTKRYTMARIKRTLLSILLGIKSDAPTHIDSLDYVTVLAIKRDKLSLLTKSTAKIITRYNDYKKTSHIFGEIDRSANALYNGVSSDKILSHQMIIVD